MINLTESNSGILLKNESKTIMTFRNRYFLINYLLCAALLLSGICIFTGCTKEMDIDRTAGNGNSAADGTPLTIRATASGFQLPAPDDGSAPATRTPVMEGTSTTFQTGDAIGLFCVRRNASGAEYISTDICNLKMTYAAAADGTTGTWQVPATESAPLLYTDAVTYFAYYPYTDELTTANVNNEQTIREWLKTNKPLPTDMSSYEVLAANDLMTATALPSRADADRGALELNFKHEYALLVIKPMLMSSYIPPAGVTAYSYHAGAGQWGIDRNIQQGWEFKMKIKDGKACEMSDGTYRILTQATNTDSFIDCNYTTHDEVYGLYGVVAIGSTISGGFQANTCYTLEVRCTERDGAAVERAVQPGDFVYQHNGKIEIYPGDGEVNAEGKIPVSDKAVGIVVTTDPARISPTDAVKWPNAYVIGLENLTSMERAWGPSDIPSSLSNVGGTAAGNYMNGYTDTEIMMKTLSHYYYPIFHELQSYREAHTVPAGVNRSPWFIPSIGQWFDVMTNLCGKSPADFESVSPPMWVEQIHAPEMLDRVNKIFNKVGRSFLSVNNPGKMSYFWCSSQLSNGSIYNFSSDGQTSIVFQWSLSTMSDYCYVRPFFAF